MNDLVWYVGYGSNLWERRFACYVRGGLPPGATRPCVGCRDRTAPAAWRRMSLPGTVYFANHSGQWGGAVAFYDPQRPGPSVGRAWLVTADQLADVSAQEQQRPFGAPIDVGTLSAERELVVGSGRYDRFLSLGELEDRPACTITSPGPMHEARLGSPSAAYLATLGRGLLEMGDDLTQVARYLTELPGADGAWTPAGAEALLTGRRGSSTTLGDPPPPRA